ncbi:MAG: abortive infection protein [Acidimicrobiales bacterium]
MLHQGVHFDTGTVFRGPGYAVSTRPRPPDPATTKRELAIVRDDLHANAVRVVGSHIERLTLAAEIALDLGLEVWFSPAFFEYPPEETSPPAVEQAAGAAAPLAAAHPGQVVFVAGSELTLFMPGLVGGRTIAQRLERLKGEPALLGNGRLSAFLNDLAPRLRSVFCGPISYAALIFEQVDWTPWDYVGLDHYRDERVKDSYVERLAPFLQLGKPVVVTEFGMRTYRGAESSGALGFGVTDTTRLWLHTWPVIGRFVRPRLRGVFERDEAMQARELAETLDILEGSGEGGALLSTFATPGAWTDHDPRYDLDMDSMSLVKALPDRRRGSTYPDMRWEPKEAFAAVAQHFSAHRPGDRSPSSGT